METYAEVLKRLLAEDARMKILDEQLNEVMKGYQVAQLIPYNNKWVQ